MRQRGLLTMIDNDMENKLVSIIITTRNEEKSIANCLESIMDQSYEYIELIVVDNNSTDNTKQIALNYTEKVYNMGPERSAQRNFGIIDVARGNYIMYIDADMTLEPELVQEAISVIKNETSLVGLFIPLRWIGNNWIIRAKGFEREFYDGTSLDAARFIRRDAFLKIGGFDNRLFAGEDWDLNKRLKTLGEIGITKNKLYHYEDESISLKDYINKIYYYSTNLGVYIDKWGTGDRDIKDQFGIYYRSVGVFTENGKWKKLVCSPILSFNMYLLKILAMMIFVYKNKNKSTI